ncbi:MAG: SDR family NAD(P)-dependent oxidoreductase [Cyclobacteriaceae bacterium]|jgi:short-subunit dehydrogenase
MEYFEGKIVLITGASSGIGEALAYELSKHRAKLILSARRLDFLDKVRDSCANPDLIKCMQFDVTRLEEVETFVSEAKLKYGSIDILINSAGVSQRCNAEDTSLALQKQIFDVNYFGAITLTMEVMKYFRQQNKGDVISISSLASVLTPPKRTTYTASKAALEGFLNSLRYEVRSTAIFLMIVRSGAVKTNIGKNAIYGSVSNSSSQSEIIEKGMTPERFAKRILKAIILRENNLAVGNFSERFSATLRRIFPGIMFRR